MPHITIKHFPVPLTAAQQSDLLATLTKAVASAFRCDEGVISIALEPVEKDAWNEKRLPTRDSQPQPLAGEVTEL